MSGSCAGSGMVPASARRPRRGARRAGASRSRRSSHFRPAGFDRERPLGTGPTRLENPCVTDRSTGAPPPIMREAGGLWKKALPLACRPIRSISPGSPRVCILHPSTTLPRRVCRGSPRGNPRKLLTRSGSSSSGGCSSPHCWSMAPGREALRTARWSLPSCRVSCYSSEPAVRPDTRRRPAGWRHPCAWRSSTRSAADQSLAGTRSAARTGSGIFWRRTITDHACCVPSIRAYRQRDGLEPFRPGPTRQQ